MLDISWTAALLFVLDWAVRLGFALHILLRRRSLAVTLIWVAMVLVVPVAGIVFYLLFGQVRVGEDRLVWSRRLTTDLFDAASARFGERGLVADLARTPGTAESAPLAGPVTGLPALRGNDARLITTTDGFLDALIADIDSADRFAYIQTYIWQRSGRAEEVADALLRAAARGVDCRVLVDAMGSRRWLISPSCDRLRRAGVRVVEELPVGLLRVLARRLDVRNHRKIAVIDARIAHVGSHNITDTSFGAIGPGAVGPWLDATVRLTGPISQALGLVVLRDWAFDAREEPGPLDDMMPQVEPIRPGLIAQPLPSGPGVDAGAYEHAVLGMLYTARREVLLATPYFVPDEALLGAMLAAARRGVRVALVLPKRNDSALVAAAARSTYSSLLAGGVEIHEFRPCLLHTKAIVRDSRTALIGSGNLDIRSFRLNFEVAVAIHDEPFAREACSLIQGYIADSDRLDPERWHRVPMHRALGYNLANLASQIL